MSKLYLLYILLFITSGISAKQKKVVYIVTDGIPTDYIERLKPKSIFEIAKHGAYSQAYTGGEIGNYSQTPTISAIGYMNILTGTWMNKHNVNGNNNLKPNYQYWSIFRIAKEQKKEFSTALYSSWSDNRTVLIGEKKSETKNLKIDYIFDGYELDKKKFPVLKDQLHIFRIDSLVAENASSCIKENAPDLNWVYLWYTDYAFHLYGDSKFCDKYVIKTDELIGKIWEAVKYREKFFDEEWLVIVTTDHGRNESGHSHGKQSHRERNVWISTNYKKVNEHFNKSDLSLVDINPTICKFMDFDVPKDVLFEQDGTPFIGKVDIKNLEVSYYDNNIIFNWDTVKRKSTKVDIYMSPTNNFLKQGNDHWIKIGSVSSSKKEFIFNKNKYPKSKFYKFSFVSTNNHLNRWVICK